MVFRTDATAFAYLNVSKWDSKSEFSAGTSLQGHVC